MPDEEQFPYAAADVRCKSRLEPAQSIVRWAYIGDGNNSPTTEQIKTAIQEYGPVSVTVNGDFGAYSSGIYNRCNTAGTNHMVTIEGWNDEGQYWIMRNSWGANWGENGYIRIKYTGKNGYKCNSIGEVAAFAQLNLDDEQ